MKVLNHTKGKLHAIACTDEMGTLFSEKLNGFLVWFTSVTFMPSDLLLLTCQAALLHFSHLDQDLQQAKSRVHK